MSTPVHFTKKVWLDLDEIQDFIAEREGLPRALSITNGILALIESLKDEPKRGHSLPEFRAIGLNDILELHFKPYRIVYHVNEQRVTVLLVADGRRNMSDLLSRRLLR